MSEIRVTVRNKIARGDGTVYVCGNRDFSVRFDLDGEWGSYPTKTARFAKENGEYTDVVFQGDLCPMPVLFGTGLVLVGVFAGDLKTSTPAVVRARRSILDLGQVPQEPEADVYAQLMEKLNGLENAAVSPEAIKAAVDAYLEENPVDALPGGVKIEAYGLPMLYLTGSTEGISKDNEMSLSYVYGERSGSCTLKWQGDSSLLYPKKNFTIKFDSKFEAVEGWGEQKKYCLKANFIDSSHARNIVSARLWGEMVKSRASYESLPELLRSSPNQGAVDGFPICLVINGVYQGLYTWNIPKDKWMFGMGDGDREAILCANVHSASTRFQSLALCDGSDFEIEYVPDEDNAQWAIDSLNTLIGAVMSSDGSDLDSVIANYVDLESVIDYYLFTALTTGADNTGKNHILATYDGVKWFFSTYDMDSTWGLSPDGNTYYNAVTGLPTIKNFGHELVKLVVAIKTDAVKTRYSELRETVLSESNAMFRFLNFFASIPACIRDEEFKLWPTIPGGISNDLSQILNNYRLRVIELDKQMNELEAEAIIPPPMLKPGKTWYTGTTAATEITQINIVSSYTATGNETEVFDVGEHDGEIAGYISGTTLTLAPTNGARRIALHPTSANLFSGFKSVEEINGTNLLTVSGAGVAHLANGFNGLSKLTSKITLPEGVTSLEYCFFGCSSMAEPPNIPSTVTSLNCAFLNCSALLTAPTIPNSFAGDCGAMLSGCSALTTLEGFVVPEGVTHMNGMFTNAKNIGNCTVTVNAQSLAQYENAFLNVALSTWATVTLVGTSPLLAELAATNTHGRVVVGGDET